MQEAYLCERKLFGDKARAAGCCDQARNPHDAGRSNGRRKRKSEVVGRSQLESTFDLFVISLSSQQYERRLKRRKRAEQLQARTSGQARLRDDNPKGLLLNLTPGVRSVANRLHIGVRSAKSVGQKIPGLLVGDG